MKKNPMLVVIAVVVVLALAAVGYFFLSSSGKEASTNTTSEEGFEEQSFRKLSPEDIGLTLTLNNAKNTVIMKITRLDGVKSIEYEAIYDAEVAEEGETNVVSRGVGPSTIEVKEGESQIVRPDIVLGTCSRNVCKYDKVVSDVTFNVRVNFKDGDPGVIEQKISLE